MEFESEKNGYKKKEVDYYITQLETEFHKIITGHTERLANVKRNVTELADDLNEYSQVVPQYKSEIESLRERLTNIREHANTASKDRYLEGRNYEIILANLINQVLVETNDITKLKPIENQETDKNKLLDGENFFEVLANNKGMNLDEALSGFDFFENNPYKAKAEKRLKKIEAKKKRKQK